MLIFTLASFACCLLIVNRIFSIKILLNFSYYDSLSYRVWLFDRKYYRSISISIYIPLVDNLSLCKLTRLIIFVTYFFVWTCIFSVGIDLVSNRLQVSNKSANITFCMITNKCYIFFDCALIYLSYDSNKLLYCFVYLSLVSEGKLSLW